MNEVKFFEVRDAATFMPVMAVRCNTSDGMERFLLGRAGFQKPEEYVFLVPLEKETWAYDCYRWGSRTLQVAHEWLNANWAAARSGSVIDVEFIIGLRGTPKVSERYEEPIDAEMP